MRHFLDEEASGLKTLYGSMGYKSVSLFVSRLANSTGIQSVFGLRDERDLIGRDMEQSALIRGELLPDPFPIVRSTTRQNDERPILESVQGEHIGELAHRPATCRRVPAVQSSAGPGINCPYPAQPAPAP